MWHLILIPLFLSIYSDRPKTLEDFRWENRLLIVFDQPDSLKNLFEKQKEALEERRLLVFHFKNRKLAESNFPGEVQAESFLKLGSNEKKGWFLIGLDGGVKRKEEILPPLESIFATIDAMPMRQSEIRKKRGSG
ncbi:DUF4174 domain-containing protein [Algoriphagus sediminis]|uniref:DUF4174 domain-containing protein n=1 Tax=Algoriphagus sediminis TaxID=3057113 RepID=A0ABT7YAL7_9BACT|nr:DUF4174 domain-containing protein [Algoriphagus sediminis]MDN3203249.1 DUF4174 domain-containing protein [Algoriphagus sediminis]